MERFSLLDLLTPQPEPIRIVDVGAMLTEHEAYAALAARGGARVTGFEPIPAERERLGRERPANRYLPYVVGDGSRRIFRTCRYPGCSSLYEPDPDVIDRFFGISAGADGNFEVLARQEVTTTRLDALAELGGCDFLKLDVQGAELDALTGAEQLLGEVLVIQAEVEFIPIYRRQPLFADVDLFLRERGFMLHKLIDVSGRAYRPFGLMDNPGQPMSQILWADAVYVPDFARLESLPPERLGALALILHDLFGSVDLCAHVLERYERDTGLPFRRMYLKRLAHGSQVDVSFVTIKTWTD